jgi:uracil-DNA glycosylase
MGVTREVFYDETAIAILPIGFCFPGHDKGGGDLPPRRECAPTWRERFFDRLPNIDLILCVGRYAQAYHLEPPRRSSVTEIVKGWQRILAASDTLVKLPLPHPSWHNSAWLKRNPWFEDEFVPVLRAEVRRRLI